MRTLGWIAMNGFRESVRDKVLYNLVAFAILLMGTSYLLGQLTAGQDLKIMKDLGLSAMSIFGLFMAVFIGIGLVSKEVERRSIYNLMAKPIRRYEVVLGKYAGLVLTLTVNVAIMTAALYLVLAYVGWGENEFARAAREAPDARSGAAQGRRADSRAADGRHGDRDCSSRRSRRRFCPRR